MAHQFDAKEATGIALRRLRTNRGYTRREVADKIGVSPQTVYHWEAGLRTPNVNDLEAYASVHNVTFSSLGATIDIAKTVLRRDHKPKEE